MALIWPTGSPAARAARSCSTRSAPSTASAWPWSGAPSATGSTRAASTSGSTPTSRSPAAWSRATPRSWARSTRPGRTRSGARHRGSRPADLAGALSAGGRRLAQAVVTLREEAPGSGFVNAHPMAHHRWMPSIEKGAPDSLGELVASGSASVEAARPGAATPRSSCSSRRPRSSPRSRSGRSSVATTGRSASAGTAAPSGSTLDRHPDKFIKFGAKRNLPGGLRRDGTSTAGQAGCGAGWTRHGRRRAVLAAVDGARGGQHECDSSTDG